LCRGTYRTARIPGTTGPRRCAPGAIRADRGDRAVVSPWRRVCAHKIQASRLRGTTDGPADRSAPGTGRPRSLRRRVRGAGRAPRAMSSLLNDRSNATLRMAVINASTSAMLCCRSGGGMRLRDRPAGPTTSARRSSRCSSADPSGGRVSPSAEDQRLGVRLPSPDVGGAHPKRGEKAARCRGRRRRVTWSTATSTRSLHPRCHRST